MGAIPGLRPVTDVTISDIEVGETLPKGVTGWP